MCPSHRGSIASNVSPAALRLETKSDYEAHPFSAIPRRVFLDTNVVNTLVNFGSQIFEQELLPGLEPTLAEDVNSLITIVSASTHAPWEIVSSTAMPDELADTRSEDTRRSLLRYGSEFIELVDVHAAEIQALAMDDLLSDSSLWALPGLADRKLLAHAIAMECDVFCTRDRATIIYKRHLLPALPIRIMSPEEWWSAIRPWAGLFA